MLSVLLVAFFFSIILKSYRQEIIAHELATLEMQLAYDYYSLIRRINEPVRHLKHDLSNHLAVLNAADRLQKEGALQPEHFEEYRTQLLSYCDEIKNLLASSLPSEDSTIPAFSILENYELSHCINGILRDNTLTFETIRFRQETDRSGAFHFSVTFPGNAARLKKRKYRENVYFTLIASIAAKHGGSCCWEKGGDTWILSLYISQPV